MKRLILSLIVSLFLVISFCSATTITLTPNSISQTIKQGESVSSSFIYSINNDQNSSQTFYTSISSSLSGLIKTDTNSITIPANTQQSGVISVNFSASSSTSTGVYSGQILVGSQVLSIYLTVNEGSTVGTCRIYTLPVPLTKSLETGTTASQAIDVYVSKYCDSALTISSNQPTMQKPITFDSVSGIVEPSGKFSIVIRYDTKEGVSRGTYNDQIIISGVDEAEHQYSLTLPISLTVTGSTSPLNSNGTFSTFPSCSLSANEMNLNVTYKLICNSIDPNLDIQPLIDPTFVIGVSPYVEETGDTYTYSFKPIQIGVTTIRANWIYKNANIGSGFSQTVKILAGNIPLAGTGLEIRFYPELYNSPDGNVVIRVVDNSTGNILENAKIYIDGLQINNNSIHLETNKEYEIRATNFGYTDLVKSITLTQRPINFTLFNQYIVGDVLNFQTIPANATILYDDEIVSLPFTLTEEGVHQITASFLGYSSTTKNITVVQNANLVSSLPQEEFKVGKTIFAQVDRNETKLKIVYLDKDLVPSVLNETVGNYISAKVDKKGTYEIYGDDNLLVRYEKKDTKWYFSWWFLTLCGIGVIIFLYLAFSGGSSSSGGGLSYSVGTGGE